jgi:hypothetical protein
MLLWLKAIIKAVATTFRENRRNDPKKDAKTSISQLLGLQLRSYKNDNPKETQQKALPVCILCLIFSSKSIEQRQVMGDLAAAAHFWAMQLCNYCKVPKIEQQQKKQLCPRPTGPIYAVGPYTLEKEKNGMGFHN